MPKKRRFKFGHSLGAVFRVLQKAIQRGHVDERQVFYVPYSFSISVHKLNVVTNKSEKVKRAMKMLELLDELD